MEKEDVHKLLIELGRTAYGDALRAYLNDKLDDIKDINRYDTWEQAQGGQEATKLIKELFSFMEDKTSTKSKNQYV